MLQGIKLDLVTRLRTATVNCMKLSCTTVGAMLKPSLLYSTMTAGHFTQLWWACLVSEKTAIMQDGRLRVGAVANRRHGEQVESQSVAGKI